MNNMKCPFCQQEMIAHPFIDNIGVAAFECKNKKCVNYKKLVPANIIKLLERTRKALETALDWLEQVATPEKCDDDLCREFTKRKLIEIKSALEQKDVK